LLLRHRLQITAIRASAYQKIKIASVHRTVYVPTTAFDPLEENRIELYRGGKRMRRGDRRLSRSRAATGDPCILLRTGEEIAADSDISSTGRGPQRLLPAPY
jgi:hypothetical protein